MIDNILRNISKGEQGTAWMEFAGQPCSQIDVIPVSLDLPSVDEIPGTNGFSNEIVVVIT